MKTVRPLIVMLGVILALLVLTHLPKASAQEATKRDQAQQQIKDGNWKDAYANLSALALDPATDPAKVVEDYNNALTCLSRLGRGNEVDDFREQVITQHGKNWRLLLATAQSYFTGEHYGFMIAGDFERGNHRGGGRYVYAYARDRIRGLQLLQEALPLVANEPNAQDAGAFYFALAQAVLGDAGYNNAWRLQTLTDLTTLPDYDEGYPYGGGWRGAPVSDDGTPVYYSVPKSWAEANNDGERWRWALTRVAVVDPNRATEVTIAFANFMHAQFGVQTMGGYIARLNSLDDTKKNESGPYALDSLKDNETIANLASGIKRFTFPDEFDYIKLVKQIADGNTAYALQCQRWLAFIYEDRRQYDKAATYWQRAGDTDRINQIIGNWGVFEPVMTQPAGAGATVEFRFRNGNQVHFSAQAIKVDALLKDVKTYLQGNPAQLNWEQMDIRNLGYRLVTRGQQQYLGDTVAAWDQDLTPRAKHFDRRTTIQTPLKKGGAYLLTGTMKNGNTSRIILWVADTAIVRKPMDHASYYFVADALSGAPVGKINVDFFGYRQNWKKNDAGGGVYQVDVKTFTKTTDDDGQLTTTPEEQDTQYTWITTASDNTRLAYLGFTGVWYGDYREDQYNAVKTFVITDRPIYRPAQKVGFKFWVNTAKYDQEGTSAFAGKSFPVIITNPKGEKIYEQTLTADDYGGFAGDVTLAKDAALGVYSIGLNKEPYGGNSFRVEEYKKPEFEVTVDAPSEPVMLGETITATVKAKYYFGAPVTNAKVHYKVLRSNYDATWYPTDRWDWLYGRAYWWYAYDCAWFPGWRDWGCKRPIPVWWRGWRPQVQPEVVMEGDAAIGADGTLPLQIDTSFAKELFGDTDHRYEVTAEVTDQSRRVIVGQGAVLVARKPFKVYAWVDRGHYRVGDTVEASFSAQALDNKPVQGAGILRLMQVSYKPDDNGALTPVETEMRHWDLNTNSDGRSQVKIKASRAGQYRLSYVVHDIKNHTIEGGYLFTVRGDGFDGSDFRYNDLELIPDQRDYQPGDQVNLMVNTNRDESTVLLFIRPSNGMYLPPKVLHLNGKSTVEAIAVAKKDMPNFFVEAVTVSGGRVITESHEVVVPPEQRILNVAVQPSAEKYLPGAPATVKLAVTGPDGKPFQGSLVMTMYDKAVEYISGGSNVPDIRNFFWQWRRYHTARTESNLGQSEGNLVLPNEKWMAYLGAFGASVADEDRAEVALDELKDTESLLSENSNGAMRMTKSARGAGMAADGIAFGAAPQSAMEHDAKGEKERDKLDTGDSVGGAPGVEPTVRSNFADTAFWANAIQTDANGLASVKLTMPENLTTWKTKVWAMGNGTAVGEASVEVLTTKNLILRLQAPRFFTQNDEVVLSANVHNFLTTTKKVNVVLELSGGCLAATDKVKDASDPNNIILAPKVVTIPANGESRVDWLVKVTQPGDAVVRMKALTNEESDAMQMTFPVYVHGMLKTESFSGVLRPEQTQGSLAFTVPAKRKPEQSRLELRYSPTLAGAMVDALPYMVAYPYEYSDATLNHFVPAVVVQQTLKRMGLNLADIRDKQANLNAQEIGNDKTRATDWRRHVMAGAVKEQNPVFDETEMQRIISANVAHLASMQCGDGGWGWFSGWGEHSWPDTTAQIVHGLQISKTNGVALPDGMLERGVAWLVQYQTEQVRRLKLPHTDQWYKASADNQDAMNYMVLADAKADNTEMRDFLYRDKNNLSVYAKAIFGYALHVVGDTEKRDMLIRNVEQYLVMDKENQTAYLKMPDTNYWWCWYGSEYEADAYYLKLLAATDAKSDKAAWLVKYLLNNRKHATYWNSTRDTAVVVEAFADFLKASGEDQPDMTLTFLYDGKKVKDVKINKDNLFSFDNKFVLEGPELTTGPHTLTVTKTGTGPLYSCAYLTNFTMEDPITSAGLEIKVNRKFYKLEKSTKTAFVEGSHGQAAAQQVEKYTRKPLSNLDTLKSGDLIEVELKIDSKNDYEYIMFEDMKAAGFEPVDLRSGYGNNEMGAYMELRDERVCFFTRTLARGTHSITYRMRAETPGTFSALPTKASAVYAPELKANSDEMKLAIED